MLPHQMSVAAQIAQRLTPRVLLADDVGLGKTIEACLVLHRLLLTGRIRRALVLVPDSLVHQWFLELLRRFNLWFHIFDEERCAAIDESGADANPFLSQQLIVAAVGLISTSERRLEQACEAGWDMVVVDEAHHLAWTPEAASPAYAAVARLTRQVPGLLLLTATPEQLGMSGHFARLRLLDPDRFSDLDEFQREAADYVTVARLAERLTQAAPLNDDDAAVLRARLGENALPAGDLPEAVDDRHRREWIDALVDRHGTGRVMFRNTRATVTGFPRRLPHLYPLEPSVRARRRGAAPAAPLRQDPRIDWLAGLLKDLSPDKVLLICASPDTAIALDGALKELLTVASSLFHERMSLVQRDRSAAGFAEPGGTRLLVCSEIGSEGRNFQFAHHLVLFDIPLDPTLVEQRIGRLDRIGQHHDVHIHVPFVVGTGQEVSARWHHEGLNALAGSVAGGRELFERFRTRLEEAAAHLGSGQAGPDTLLSDVAVARKEVAERLSEGRDWLLEWNSRRPEISAPIIDGIHRLDDDPALEAFMLSMFDLHFVDVEDVAPRTWRLASAGTFKDLFPGLTSDGVVITCDRQRAVTREDIQFLTWDHPLVTGALDRLLASEHGNCSAARTTGAVPGLFVEAMYVLECVAPPGLHVDRFLPPAPIRVVLDHRGREVSRLPHDLTPTLDDGSAGRTLLDRADVREGLLPKLLAHAERVAERAAHETVVRARQAMHAQLTSEAARLEALQQVNRMVRPEDVRQLTDQRASLDEHLAAARLRLDAVRVISVTPAAG